MREEFVKNWKIDCSNNKKLETYRKLGGDFGFKDYLNSSNIRSRDIMARLRSGSNALRIDTGRRLQLSRKERNCKLCRENTEDAGHFLFNCPTLTHNRSALIKTLSSQNTKNITKENHLGLQEKIFGSSNNSLTNSTVLSHVHRMYNIRKKILREDSYLFLWGR